MCALPEAARGTAEAHDCRREQDAAASSTCVVAQSDGTLRLSGYVGGGAVSEFNAEDGVYTASVDGMYSVCALSSQPLSSDIGFLTLVHSHASGATSVHTHIDPARYELSGAAVGVALVILAARRPLLRLRTSHPVQSLGAARRLAGSLEAPSRRIVHAMITAVKVAVQARSDAYLVLHHVLGLAAARSDLGLAAAVARSLLGLGYG